MARHASTYRQARRAAWKESGGSWAEFNAMKQKDGFGIRVWRNPTHLQNEDRSRYVPHIGNKQRAKAKETIKANG